MKNVFKFVWIGLIVSVVLSALVTFLPRNEERFVSVVQESLPKTVDIKVPAIATEYTLHISNEGALTVETSTVAVIVGGSGVFISPNGHILTCAHLFHLPRRGKIQITLNNGKKLNAVILSKDTQKDLALLKVYTDPVPYAVLSAEKLQVGQEVLAIGSPLGQTFTVTHGIISFIKREKTLNQEDAFINPGNSGGPLFNLQGELVGINDCILPPVNAPIFTGLGYSVTIETINEFLNQFRGL